MISKDSSYKYKDYDYDYDGEDLSYEYNHSFGFNMLLSDEFYHSYGFTMLGFIIFTSFITGKLLTTEDIYKLLGYSILNQGVTKYRI